MWTHLYSSRTQKLSISAATISGRAPVKIARCQVKWLILGWVFFLRLRKTSIFYMIGSFFQQIMKGFSILYDSVYWNSPYISNMLCIIHFAIEVLHTKGHYYLKISRGILWLPNEWNRKANNAFFWNSNYKVGRFTQEQTFINSCAIWYFCVKTLYYLLLEMNHMDFPIK